MTIDEMLAVLQAKKQGKDIQYRLRNSDAKVKWDSCSIPVWNFAIYDYRVKPKKLEIVIYHGVDARPAVATMEQWNNCSMDWRLKYPLIKTVKVEV